MCIGKEMEASTSKVRTIEDDKMGSGAIGVFARSISTYLSINHICLLVMF